MTTPPSAPVPDAPPVLPPPRADLSAAAGLLTLAGALFWPIAMNGEFDTRDYLGVLAGGAAVILLGLVLLVARGSRTLGTAMLAGGLPVASMQVWWLLTDAWADDWPVPVSSLLLTTAGLTAAFARRDPAVPSRHRRRAFGLTAIGLLGYVVALAADPGWYAAVVAVAVLVVPTVVTFGALVGRRLGTALATMALLLGFTTVQEISADSFLTGPILLRALAVLAIAAAALVAALNPVVSYRQRTPVAPAIVGVVAAVATVAAGIGLAASAAAEPIDDTAGAAPVPSAFSTTAAPTPPPVTPSPGPTATGSSAAATPLPTYSGQRPVSASTAGLDPRCDTTPERVICVDKERRKLYFVVDGELVLTLDTRFGGVANPTREGDFSIYRKDADHVSTAFGSSMPYAMFFDGGEAIHYSSDFAARGYEGHSHGCVNIRDKAALAWLFEQVPLGTPVYIYG